MEDEGETLAAAIGARVRAQRQLQRRTLDQLAEAARVSRRMLVNIEQGTANPSVGILLKLSEALAVPLPTLVQPPARTPVRVTPAGTGPVLWSSPGGGRAVLVASRTDGSALELWDWTLAADDRYESTAHAPGTGELVHVHEGRLVVEVGDQLATLDAGDAASFRGDLTHAYVNGGPVAAHFSLTVLEPGPGPRTRLEPHA